ELRLLPEPALTLTLAGELPELRLLPEPALTLTLAGELPELRLLPEPALTLTLLALLHQRQDRDGQRLLYGLLHRAAHALEQGVVQRDSQVRVRLVGQALLLQLLLDLLNLLQRLLHALRDLQARLLTGLLDRLLDHLRELLLRPGHLLAEHLLLPVRLLALRLADLLGGVDGHAEILLERRKAHDVRHTEENPAAATE
ncbi:hypothetical protein, partial [Streptomyces sp. NPDC006459]|uniref:hypothetical protein n=1 Tax=Streptomyces sp. NPDC006459 TaxID=3154303 RepID=UPI0033B2E59B